MPRLLESEQFIGQKVETRFPVNLEPTAELIGKIERFNIKSIAIPDGPFPFYGVPS